MAEMRREFLDDTLADIASIDDSADRIADFTDGVDQLVAGQREVVLAQLERELTRVLESIDRQRVETIEFMLAEVDTAQVTLSKELEKAIQEVKQERVALMSNLEAYTERTLEIATADSKSLIDYLFRRAMQLVLFVAGIVIVVMVLARFIFRGRRTQARA
jgi:recombinational DNA repair ATPase RecF